MPPEITRLPPTGGRQRCGDRHQAVTDPGRAVVVERAARQVVDVFHTVGGPDEAMQEARNRVGGWFDPKLIDALERVSLAPEYWPIAGPVLNGTAAEHTGVNLHVFTDTPEEVGLFLTHKHIRTGEQAPDLDGWRHGQLSRLPFCSTGCSN